MTTTDFKSLHGKKGGKDMRYAGFLSSLLIRGHSWRCVRAFTLVELLITMAIAGTFAAIGVPTYNGYVDKARCATAMADIRDIDVGIARFKAERGRLPITLAEAGYANPLDPWGNPYQYVRLEGLDKNDFDAKCRWDKHEKPLNWDFDLGSIGKDGQTKPKITHQFAYDDIIRANGGKYIGMASEY
jgi:general secretion pathway protein G